MATVQVSNQPNSELKLPGKVITPPAIKDDSSKQLLAGEHTLPASWWHSENIFNLEKRAIFHKSWLYCIHNSRFTKPGDYFSFNVTGINFFIIKSKNTGELKAFHNVCRHRAYPVVKKASGTSTVLTCQYHGWSYNSEGKLSKAPHFEEVKDFVKEENSLFPIPIHVTPQGLIFVNFCNSPLPFEDFFTGLTEELHEIDFQDYEYHMSYELHGDFNWKTLIDGYNECYHCPISHRKLSAAFNMETYKVVPKTRYCRHYAAVVKEEEPAEELQNEEKSGWFGFGKKEKSLPEQRQKASNTAGTSDGLWCYLYPSNGVNCYSPAWYSIRVLPHSAKKTTLQYDIYTKKGIDEAQKKEFVDFLQLVEIEDFDLCQLTQKNLNEGIYSSGYLHPQKENGVLFYQKLVRDMVKEHFEMEQANGGLPIDPASIQANPKNKEILELEKICQTLDCSSGNGDSKMDW
ncbi:hypothetical protein KGF54_001938 [Candida jiufengensis]|uniref:uncharacterized protein n=1 Tax=Candida jiufengensis TaxID=497108 RepID=UPI00222537A5|nr:uncharacterized protein KGF54_001938 [Candida jiufengensis]KAI5955377.1 hypothetical protein KGF54_001938 [Candida jiufengensis]